MLMLRYKKDKNDYIWKSKYFKRKLSGLVCVMRWQRIYRGMELMSLGTHVPDEAKAFADIGFGLSVNLVGFHMFVGLLFETHAIKVPQKGLDSE